MPSFFLAERILHPGALDSYRAAAREAARRWETAGGALSYRLFQSDADPDRILRVNAWRSAADYEAAHVQPPDDALQPARDAVKDLLNTWHAYRPVLDIRLSDDPPGTVVAGHFTVNPDDIDRLVAGQRDIQDRLREMDGIVTHRLLVNESREDEFQVLAEYRDEAAKQAVLAMVAAIGHRVNRLGFQRFTGTLLDRWDA